VHICAAMNDVQATQTSQSDLSAAPPTPIDVGATKSSNGGFSLDGFLGDSRRVTGQGGYVYEQFADGDITIVAGPKNVGRTYPVGDPVNQAITAEIERTHGPFPVAAAPEAAEPATPEPVAGGLIPSLDEIVAGVGGAASAIGDALASAGDALSSAIGDFFGGDDAGAAPDAPVTETPTPETPAVDAPAPASGTPEFLDQRDNTFDKDGVSADNMCTVTSLAMALIALCGSADAVNKETASLITSHGGKPPADLAAVQTEDLLMTFFDLLAGQSYWDQFTKSTEAPFYGNWRNDVPSGTKFHQAGACQAHVMSMFRGVSGSNVSRKNAGRATIQEFLEKDIKPEMDAGATFAMSTRLTDGHFVALVEVKPGVGLVIQDPFGAKTSSGHLKNNTDAKRLTGNTTALDELAVRFSENSALLEAVQNAPGEVRGNWGERNFFTWAEVEKWKIGDYGTKAGAA